ncbi:hypothetical protein D3C76_1532000 [compost metagenome]
MSGYVHAYRNCSYMHIARFLTVKTDLKVHYGFLINAIVHQSVLLATMLVMLVVMEDHPA